WNAHMIRPVPVPHHSKGRQYGAYCGSSGGSCVGVCAVRWLGPDAPTASISQATFMNPGVRSTDMAAQSVVGIYDTMARAEEAVTRAAESVLTRARPILYQATV